MSDETDGQLLYSNESVATAPSVEELVFDELLINFGRAIVAWLIREERIFGYGPAEALGVIGRLQPSPFDGAGTGGCLRYRGTNRNRFCERQTRNNRVDALLVGTDPFFYNRHSNLPRWQSFMPFRK